MLTQAKADLGEEYHPEKAKLGWQEICEQRLGFKPMKCSHCGRTMIRLRSVPPIRNPPNYTENAQFYKQNENKIA